MAILNLESYRSKSINAYLVKLYGLNFNAVEMDFGKPLTDRDKAAANKSKSHTVGIDLGAKLDGYYRYKEASGHRIREGWLLIRNAEVVEEWATEEDYAIAHANAICKFPELQGTDKQVTWANQIRAKVIIILDFEAIDNWAENSTAYQAIAAMPCAKDWIENCGGIPGAIAQSMIQSWQFAHP
jgi:hypothetical protein